MFYSMGFPGILPARPVKANAKIAQGKGRMHVGMAPDKPVDSQGFDIASVSDEATALSMLYERFKRPIHSYIYRLLGSQEDADDVTQEVFVRACVAWDGLYERNNLSAWLYRIATNLCVDLMRRRKRISWWPLVQRNASHDRFDSGISDDNSFLLPDNGGIPEIAEREHIRMAMSKLPEEYAVVLTLSAAQGLPYQEIAAIVGISPNAAATRISRAKRMFAEEYEQLSKEGVAKQERKR